MSGGQRSTLLALLVLGACQGPQSAFVPAGVEAERMLGLWWTMAAGAVVIYVLVIGAAVYAARIAPERQAAKLVGAAPPPAAPAPAEREPAGVS